MKKTVISLVAVAALASSAFAANSVSEAFANGKVSGNAYFRFASASNSGDQVTNKANWKVNNKGESKEVKTSTWSLATLGINYSTASVYGLSLNAGFMGYAPVYQDEWNSARKSGGASGTDSLMAVSNLQFSNKLVTVKAGRQAVGLEWLTHYIQGVTAVVNVPMTQIVLGWATQRSGSSNATNRMKQFASVYGNGNGGAVYAVEATVTPMKLFNVKGYFYDAPTKTLLVGENAGGKAGFSAYGLNATVNAGPLSVTGKYAGTSENGENSKGVKAKNGSFMALIAAVSVPVNKLTLGVDGGYAMAGKDNGSGSLGSLGDSTNPFDDGSDFYNADAKSFWVNASVGVSAIAANLRYGSTSLPSSAGEDEINVGVSYAGIKNTTLGISYDNLNYKKGATGANNEGLKNNTFKFDASYSF